MVHINTNICKGPPNGENGCGNALTLAIVKNIKFTYRTIRGAFSSSCIEAASWFFYAAVFVSMMFSAGDVELLCHMHILLWKSL